MIDSELLHYTLQQIFDSGGDWWCWWRQPFISVDSWCFHQDTSVVIHFLCSISSGIGLVFPPVLAFGGGNLISPGPAAPEAEGLVVKRCLVVCLES
jgi:hypothetical protein